MSPKVLLVYPNIWSDVFPLSVLILSAVLKGQGCEVEVFSAVHRRRVNSAPGTLVEEGPEPGSFEEFRRAVAAFQPDLIGFSVVEDAWPLARKLLAAIPDYDGRVLVGGVFATFAPDKVIAQPRVDGVCVGEGELALAVLCRRLAAGAPWRDVPGLWLRQPDGSLQKNPPGPPLVLDELPLPDYGVLDRRRFQGPVPLIAHRGCPYPCSFCNSPAQARLAGQGGAYFRKESLAKVRRQLEALTGEHADKLNASGLYFCSDTLLAWTRAEFEDFLAMYADFRVPFVCHTTPETLSAERIGRLAEVGLKLVNVGVQHGNEAFRREVLRRRMANAELKARFAEVANRGAWISADFIMGFPGETPALAADSIRFSREIQASARNCSVFVPYHGTELRAVAVREGFLDPDTLAVWSPEQSQLDMPAFPKQRIAELMRVFRGQGPGSAALPPLAESAC